MKKFYIMLLALLVTLVIIIPSAVPVMAKNPQDNKPVAWVNSATNTNNGPPYHIAESASVKLLADGTTVGKVVTHNWEMGWKEFGNTFDDTETKFYREGESKIAVFVVHLRQEPSGFEFKMKFTVVDNGEGKNSDPDTLWLDIWAPDFNPAAPPIWVHATDEPTPLANGNNQVHLPDED